MTHRTRTNGALEFTTNPLNDTNVVFYLLCSQNLGSQNLNAQPTAGEPRDGAQATRGGSAPRLESVK